MSRRRAERQNRRTQKTGLPPGAPVWTGADGEGRARIRAVIYDGRQIRVADDVPATDCRALATPGKVAWFHVRGTHDVEAVRELAESFRVHPLALEDVLSADVRPKVDDYGDTILVATQQASVGYEPIPTVDLQPCSIILGPGWVLSFLASDAESFEPVLRLLEADVSTIRCRGADYLLHAILDAVVDRYFLVLERLETAVDQLEDRALEEIDPHLTIEIQALRSRLLALRRVVWPLREAMATLGRADRQLMEERTRPYIRDVNDHVMQVLEGVDLCRERLAGVIEAHVSAINLKTNEIVRVLTVISSIFIPLTFVVGVYGMNFDNMPELHWQYGYHAIMAAQVALAAALAWWFRRRDWL